jgi:hypothetical protein
VRSANASSFPFDARESAVSPPEWFALPFSEFLLVLLYAEFGMAELRLPSKYVEYGKYSAQRTFHPTTKEINYSATDIITNISLKQKRNITEILSPFWLNTACTTSTVE